MKIQLLSDLHLESDPTFVAEPTPGADLLVLAGDIGSYQQRSRLATDDFGLGRYAPRHGWPTPVVYVPGNHEYDNLDFDETHERLQALCQALGIHWLERETLVIALYYFENLTLREIGEVLGVTESRVSQLHSKAVLRLRSRLKTSG